MSVRSGFHFSFKAKKFFVITIFFFEEGGGGGGGHSYDSNWLVRGNKSWFKCYSNDQPKGYQSVIFNRGNKSSYFLCFLQNNFIEKVRSSFERKQSLYKISDLME